MRAQSDLEVIRTAYVTGRLDERVQAAIDDHGYFECEGTCGRRWENFDAARVWRDARGRRSIEPHHTQGRVPRYEPGKGPGADAFIEGCCQDCHDDTEPDPDYSRRPDCTCERSPSGALIQHDYACPRHGLKVKPSKGKRR